MKDQMERLMRNFDWGACLTVGMLMTGVCLLLIALITALVNGSWKPLLILIPSIVSFAVAAGVAL